MTEREKMLAGLAYNGSHPDLVATRIEGRKVLAAFHALAPELVADRMALIAKLFESCGQNVHIETPFFCDYGGNIVLGDRVWINSGCTMLDCNRILIGPDTKLGPNVQIITVGHPIDPNERRTGIESASPIVIGSNVWIGAGAILLPGVIIGDDSVIGAGAVVTRDVPSRAVVVGSPARVVRMIP